MKWWRPVFLFQLDFVRVIYSIVICLAAAFVIGVIFKYGGALFEKQPTFYDKAKAEVTNDIHITTILCPSKDERGYTWDVFYKKHINAKHPKGWVDITWIEIDQVSRDKYWRVMNKNDPSGKKVFGMRNCDIGNIVSLESTYFREAYRTAEAIIMAWRAGTFDGDTGIRYNGVPFVFPHSIHSAAARMMSNK